MNPPAIDLATLATLESDIGDRYFVHDTVGVYLAELPDRVAATDGVGADAAELRQRAWRRRWPRRMRR